MQSGSYTVKDRTDISGLSTAVQTAVDVGYPDDFHPMMLQVTDDRLQELVELSTEVDSAQRDVSHGSAAEGP